MADLFALGAGATRIPALSGADRAAWAALHAAARPHASPFLHPAYAEAVATARGDVRVLVERRDGALVGATAFVVRGATAMTLGGRMSDVHGPLRAPGAVPDVAGALRAAGIARWRFDRLAAEDVPAGAYVWRSAPAPELDLTGGFDGYRTARRAAGSETIDQGLRKARKLAREVGPLRLVWHDDDLATLARLMKWKADQRLRTASPDVFAEPFARAAVQSLVAPRDAELRGLVASLWAGDHLVAAHLGVATRDVLACWVPTYDPAFAGYSPGLVMLVELTRAACERGVSRLDLGPGDERYKGSLSTGARDFASGELDLSRWRGALNRALRAARERIRETSFERTYARSKDALRRAALALRRR